MNEFLSKSAFRGDAPAAADAAALVDRKELALVAVERTHMPMVVTDPRRDDNPVVLANQAFLDLTGYTVDEVIGRNCRFMQGPETAASAVNDIRSGVAAGKHHVTTELLNYRKDGSTFWNRLCISPVCDEEGVPLYYFASQQDVSDKYRVRELEGERHRLLMEVDHRSMNALALVNSFMQLSTGDTTAGYAAAVTGRIDTLARVHRKLAASGWSGSNLRDLIEGEIPFALSDRVEIAGPTIEIPALLIQPFALIVHELMANALIHGALRTAQGRISICWTLSPENSIRLEWCETGGNEGPAEKTAEHGIGLSLVESLVEQQLGGQTWSFRSTSGVDRVVVVPLPTLQHMISDPHRSES